METKLDLAQTTQLVYDRLMERPRPGYDPAERGCRYRAPRGGRCAVGVLMDDKDYKRVFDRNSLTLAGLPFIPSLVPYEYDALRQLQELHDATVQEHYADKQSLRGWRKSMTKAFIKFAAGKNLDFTHKPVNFKPNPKFI